MKKLLLIMFIASLSLFVSIRTAYAYTSEDIVTSDFTVIMDGGMEIDITTTLEDGWYYVELTGLENFSTSYSDNFSENNEYYIRNEVFNLDPLDSSKYESIYFEILMVDGAAILNVGSTIWTNVLGISDLGSYTWQDDFEFYQEPEEITTTEEVITTEEVTTSDSPTTTENTTTAAPSGGATITPSDDAFTLSDIPIYVYVIVGVVLIAIFYKKK